MASPNDRVLATPASVAFIGPEVVRFLSQPNVLNKPTIFITAADGASDFIPDEKERTQRHAALKDVMASSGVAAAPLVAARMIDQLERRQNYTTMGMGNDGQPVQIITVSQDYKSGAEFFRHMARLPASAPVKVGGTAQEWRALTFFHEVTHHTSGHSSAAAEQENYGGGKEIIADQGAARLYAQAHQAGVVSDASVPAAQTAARLIGAVVGMRTSEHAMAGLGNAQLTATLTAATPQSADARAKARDDMALAQGSIYAETLRLHSPEQYHQLYAQAIVAALRESGDPTPLARDLLRLAEQANANQPGAQAQLHEVVGRMQQDPPSAFVHERAQETMRKVATKILDANFDAASHQSPFTPYMLQAAANVQAQGRLKDNSTASAVLTAFIGAAQTYAPDSFYPPQISKAPTAELVDLSRLQATTNPADQTTPEPAAGTRAKPTPIRPPFNP